MSEININVPGDFLADTHQMAQSVRQELLQSSGSNVSANLQAVYLNEVTVHRIVDFEVGTGDGRTLHTRIVPWDTPATVSDPPHFQPYQEAWARGSFDKQLKAANRVDVLMNFEHERGIGGVVGRGLELRDGGDGLHGTFRMLTTQDADKALELVREQILTGMSLEARALRSETVDGIVVRKDARLVNVALCRNPAFKDAQVLAVRETTTEEPPPDDGEEGEEAADRERIVVPERPKHLDPEQRDRLETLGIDTTRRPKPLDDAFVERLELLGIDTKKRAIVDKEWNGSASNYADTAAYCSACLIDTNPPGADKVQTNCHLPIKEPNGDINIRAVRNALARVNQVQAPAQEKTRARTRLQALLAQFKNQSGGS